MLFQPNAAALIVDALRGLQYHEDMPAQSHLRLEVCYAMMTDSLHKKWNVDSARLRRNTHLHARARRKGYPGEGASILGSRAERRHLLALAS